MSPRKKKSSYERKTASVSAEHTTIIGSGLTREQEVSDTLETNFMPYAMSVIISRAIPEIDGFKPAHRKLLYTMFTMGLLGNTRTKSANIVGQTMKLNPHGDAAIYDTMVRLTRGNGALLHPYVDSKGNFGKAFSRDTQAAAARYTEAKLESISSELFRDINKDTVDFTDNYDATLKEPTLLPVTFPSVLVNANTGIAVGIASNICPFNLREVCTTAIALIRDEHHNISDTLTGPDFPGGGLLVYNKQELEKIYETGRGGFKVRSVWNYDADNRCIDITQIPPTTTVEAIIDKTVELIKTKKITEIADIRDETGLQGLRITIDLKRGADPDKLMQRLMKMTPLEDAFSCNFNVLIGGTPRVLGVSALLDEWIGFRVECVKRRIYFDLKKAKDKLHLLKGLEKILLDIDKAVKIVRETAKESEVVPNLMMGFGIDEIQANYVAEIKLRHLNREYILNRTADIEKLTTDIAEMEDTLSSNNKIKKVIIGELKDVADKYGTDRKTQLYYPVAEDELEVVEEVPDYPVCLFFTRDGYFKKVTPQSLRMSGEQKLKEGDEIAQTVETTNAKELLFFTDKCQVYKTRASEFDDTKISLLGDYVPAKLDMDGTERPIYMAVVDDYSGYMLFFFENGKAAKVAASAYKTKNNRKKLVSAYSDKSPLVAAAYIENDCEFLLHSSNGRMLLVDTAALAVKSTKDTQGVAVMTQRKGHRLMTAEKYAEGMLNRPHRYRAKSLPSAGSFMKEDEQGDQLMF